MDGRQVILLNGTDVGDTIRTPEVSMAASAVSAIGEVRDYLLSMQRDIAKNNNVPIVENRPVARALYNSVPVDGIIPSDLYVAVAEILAYVYNSKRET